MNKIYLSGNYVIVEKDGNVYEYPRTLSVYTLEGSNYVIKERIDDGQFAIPISQIGTYFDEAGAVAYDEASLVAFLRTNTGFKTAGGGSPADADAQLFIDAASITDSTQQSAINQLVIDLKDYGIWTKMKAIYPFVGGTATSHKFNLKDPRDLDVAFRLVFNGGWTHSATGVQGNGVNGYANTFFTPSVQYSVVDNAHFSMYSRLNQNQVDVDLGVLTSPGNYFSLAIYRSDQLNRTFYNINSNTAAIVIDNNSVGFYNGTRLGTAQKGFKNGVMHANNTISGGALSTSNVYISVINQNGSPVNGFYSNKQYAFSSMGDGLTDIEAADFYTAIQAYQTTLSRQV